MPDYSCRNLLFIADWHRDDAYYDALGATAMEAVENALSDMNNEKLNAIWKELDSNDA